MQSKFTLSKKWLLTNMYNHIITTIIRTESSSIAPPPQFPLDPFTVSLSFHPLLLAISQLFFLSCSFAIFRLSYRLNHIVCWFLASSTARAKFPSRVLNPHHSSDQSCCNDNARSLTYCIARELQYITFQICFFFFWAYASEVHLSVVWVLGGSWFLLIDQ